MFIFLYISSRIDNGCSLKIVEVFFLNEPKLFRRDEFSFVQELLQCLMTAFLDLHYNGDKFLEIYRAFLSTTKTINWAD